MCVLLAVHRLHISVPPQLCGCNACNSHGSSQLSVGQEGNHEEAGGIVNLVRCSLYAMTRFCANHLCQLFSLCCHLPHKKAMKEKRPVVPACCPSEGSLEARKRLADTPESHGTTICGSLLVTISCCLSIASLAGGMWRMMRRRTLGILSSRAAKTWTIGASTSPLTP